MLFSISISATETQCELDFEYLNTGTNMTFVIQNSAISSISSLGDGLIGVFYYDNNEDLVCAGSAELTGIETAFPLMGNDQTTEDIDGLNDGQELFVLFETSQGDQYFLTPHPTQNFVGNDIYYVNEFDMDLFCSAEIYEYEDVYGCTDEDANNFNPEASTEDNTCIYFTFGCTDPHSCNYNSDANQEDESCFYPVEESSYDLNISPANWGGETFDFEDNHIVPIDESDDLGCHDYTFEFDGAFALIKRGDCQFSLKALNAQNAGASAVIIYNHNNGYESMNMGGGSYSDEIDIPVYSMSGYEGHLLASWIENDSPNYQAFIQSHNLHIIVESMDCEGNSLNNEDEISGCMENTACNYNDQASQEDDCYFAEVNYDCNGDCLLDENNDGICDEYQIPVGDCLPLDYNYLNTGSNMTFALANSSLISIGSLGEGYLGAFFTNNQEELVCAGSSYINGTETAFPIMGDDLTTDEIDGMDSQNLNLIFTALNGLQYQLNAIPNQVFVVNEIYYVTSFDFEMIQCEEILGCLDVLANNFNDLANIEDGSCTYNVFGCMDDLANNFNELANTEDGSCNYEVLGCMDDLANNFNESANTEDGSCTYDVLGCLDDLANNFNELANTEDGSCSYQDNICGCTNEGYIEYFTQGYLANCEDGSCQIPVQTNGLSISHFNFPLNTANNMTLGLDISSLYLPQGTTIGVFYDLNGDGLINNIPSINSANEVFFECVGLASVEDNFIAIAIWGDDVLTEELDGLPNGASEVLFAFLLPNESVVMFDLSPSMFSFSSNGLLALDTVNLEITVYGCTDSQYCNYNAYAEIDDGSCEGAFGCMDAMYSEFNADAYCHSADLCEDTWQEEMTDMISQYENILFENNTLLDSLNILAVLSVSLENDLLIANSIISNNQVQMAQMSTEIVMLNTSVNETNSLLEQMNDSIVSMTDDMMSIQDDLDSTSQLMIASQANEIFLNTIVDDMSNQMLVANETIIEMTLMVDDLNSVNNEVQNELSSYLLENTYLVEQMDSLEMMMENTILSDNNSSSSIQIDLLSGWNIIGYTLPNPQDAVASFESISEILSVAKDNIGQVYWPEFGYNGIGDLTPGLGYQVLVTETYEDFVFVNSEGLRINLIPLIPQWAIDMEVAIHPNDIRTLVRVVNQLGQEVVPEKEFKGTLLYYLFNDGSVEKRVK